LRRTICCADCHNPDPKFGWSDGRKLAVGDFGNPNAPLGILGLRNSRTLINCGALENRLCWGDGRTDGLFNQCMTAVQDPRVGAMPSVQAVVDRINAKAKYRELALAAYGSPTISEGQLRDCMVAFLKTIRSDDLPADRLAAGLPVNLPAGALRGGELFKIHCTSCHNPATDWRDYEFHNIGIAARSQSTDTGRGAVTNNPADNYAFATPTLREVAKHQPFMHDGSLPTLVDVAAFKGAGGRFKLDGQIKRDPNTDERIKSINLNADQQADVVDFLELAFQNPPSKYPYRKEP
jgi:cytochrome c peroxidase